MLFDLISVCPNDREPYQKRVEKLCNLLKDSKGSVFRVPVFILLTISGISFSNQSFTKFRDHPQAKWFMKLHRLDPMAHAIIDELDNIYAETPNEIDNLRGAVGEVFSYFICRKVFVRAGIEVNVKIANWTSRQIDAAGCSDEMGYCLQSKCSPKNLRSIVIQKRDLDKIEQLTSGRGKGAFITFVDRRQFQARLNSVGIDPSKYRVFDRVDLAVLEQRLS